jgi:hypothetical protein
LHIQLRTLILVHSHHTALQLIGDLTAMIVEIGLIKATEVFVDEVVGADVGVEEIMMFP